MLKKLLLLSMFVMICFKAFGATQLVLDITGDRKVSPENKLTKLLVDVDESGDVNKVIYQVLMPNGTEDDRKEFDPRDHEGSFVVLVNESGRDVVKLWVDTFARHNGGNFKLDYLVSGVSGKRGSMPIELAYDGEKWELLDAKTNKVLKSLHFVGNTFFGKLVGIKSIQKHY